MHWRTVSLTDVFRCVLGLGSVPVYWSVNTNNWLRELISLVLTVAYRAVHRRDFNLIGVLRCVIQLEITTQARASQHWSPEGKRSGESKRPTFHPPRSRMICVQPDKYWHCFEGNLGETFERRGGAPMGLSECYDDILDLKVKLTTLVTGLLNTSNWCGRVDITGLGGVLFSCAQYRFELSRCF